jgi:thiol-disulfide isomerase/thioredoxin
MRRVAPRRLLAAVLLPVALLVVGALAGCSTGKDAVNENAGSANRYVAGDGKTIVYPVADRKVAPAVTGSTLDGASFDLASRKGHVVVLNFWASWCAPCRLESADLEAVHQSTKDSGVDFLGVDSRDEKDAAVSFVAGRVTYPSLFDPSGRIALRFADVPPTTLPSTLILDRSGKVAVVIRAVVRQDDLAGLVAQIGAES